MSQIKRDWLYLVLGLITALSAWGASALAAEEPSLQKSSPGSATLINDPSGRDGRLMPLSTVFAQDSIMQRARGVALLKVSTGPDVYYPCSGFLVGTRTLLTNYHCIQNQAVCEATEFVFGYWRDQNNELSAQESFRCDRYLGGQAELDFALVTLKGLEKGQQKWPWLPLSLRPLEKAVPLYIPQHPRGTPMQVSGPVVSGGGNLLAGYSCGVNKSEIPRVKGYQDNSNFSYNCGTEPGSSGSPVLNAHHCVVGLHHGSEKTSSSGNPVAGLNLGVIMKILRPILTDRAVQSACQ